MEGANDEKFTIVNNELYEGKQEEAVASKSMPATSIRPKRKPVMKHNVLSANDNGPRSIIEEFYPSGGGTIFRNLMIAFSVVYFGIVSTIMFMGYTDPFDSYNQLVQDLLVGIGISVLIVLILTFFYLSTYHLHIKFGLYGGHFSHFKWLYISCLFELALYIASKAYFIALLYQYVPHLSYWVRPGYFLLWIAQRIILLPYLCFVASAALSIFNEKFFDPERISTAART